MNKQCR